MKRFEENIVLITGAGRGIGKGIAKRFAEEGASLILSANEESVHKVAEELKTLGINANFGGVRSQEPTDPCVGCDV
jgi:meso-butanediol dehydrogenase / (S,S)-butanediol dehydrogenase / diacetyl reductase